MKKDNKYPTSYAELKEKLARNIPTAPLFDINRYTHNIEAAYIRMWDNWRAGEAPKAIIIDAK